eukprot:6194664-Pleurochrysis_carterae.AAC.2
MGNCACESKNSGAWLRFHKLYLAINSKRYFAVPMARAMKRSNITIRPMTLRVMTLNGLGHVGSNWGMGATE